MEEARKLITGRYPLGRPPEDLVVVLAYLALGGPGVVALRALWRGADRHDTPLASREKAANLAFRTHAAQIAWSFRSLYNLPEVTALLRGLTLRDLRHNDPYWRRVLVYNTLGGLQAVLDEFVHVLRDSLGLLDELPATLTKHVSTAICNALSLRTAALGVDQIAILPDGAGMSVALHRLGTHFALRFGEEKHDDGKGENRKEQVRQAFNSPFWPFVLATTSVGQEELDFHTYCHAIVHWNLPSNPADLEQREGRIHRYKGHAVRKNLAGHYGLEHVRSMERDPWNELFETGRRNRPVNTLDGCFRAGRRLSAMCRCSH